MTAAPIAARVSSAFQTIFFQSAPLGASSRAVFFGRASLALTDRTIPVPPAPHLRVRRAQDGTYALEVGQMSDVVDSDSGLHIIYRTA